MLHPFFDTFRQELYEVCSSAGIGTRIAWPISKLLYQGYTQYQVEMEDEKPCHDSNFGNTYISP